MTSSSHLTRRRHGRACPTAVRFVAAQQNRSQNKRFPQTGHFSNTSGMLQGDWPWPISCRAEQRLRESPCSFRGENANRNRRGHNRRESFGGYAAYLIEPDSRGLVPAMTSQRSTAIPKRELLPIEAPVRPLLSLGPMRALRPDMPGNLHVRNIDDDLIIRLKRRALRHGRSAEAEHRDILRQVLTDEPEASFDDLAAELRAIAARRRQTPSELLLRDSRGEW
jgi:antitoxin FitA